MSTQFSIKYRPKVLSEVFGQEPIVKELKNRTLKNVWPNAILFYGRYGTGKTTMAQIVAMNANCKNTDDQGNACQKCASCVSIMTEQFSRDTQVLDGSLIGGKGDMTDFLSNINSPPLYDPRRIMIIEEADQLSKSAINALHKVLEKPRDNILFILLSMISNGVPASIASRCQKYSLKDSSIKDIMFYLKSLLEKESLWNDSSIPDEFKTKGLACIAEGSNGSLREAVQHFEKCLMGEYYTVEEIQTNLNLLTEDISINMVEDLLELRMDKIFRKLDEMDPYDFINFVGAIVSNIFALLISGYSKQSYYAAKNMAIGRHKNFLQLAAAFDELFKQSKPFIRKSEVFYILSKYAHELKKTPDGVSEAAQQMRIRGIR
jgi:DNA polymerase-3 subunit gamma/tau